MYSSSSSSVETTLSSTKPMLKALSSSKPMLKALSSSKPMLKDLDDEAKLASLPSGFRFQPSDEILIDCYLARKNKGEALSANRMKEVLDFYDHHPKKLTQDYKGYESSDWYLFTRKYTGKEAVGGSVDNTNGTRKYSGEEAVGGSMVGINGVRIRYAGEGCWMSTNRGSLIRSSKDSTIIGCKVTWDYYEVRGTEEHETEYVMTEFMMSGWKDYKEENDEWVLCAIFKK